jgi:hypothetical protein
MGFVLGSEDFRRIRQDRAERDFETDRINIRNFAEDAHRLRRHGADDPANPYGIKLGAPPPVNQVGLTAAQKEAQRVYNEKVAAAEAARATAKAAEAAEAKRAGLKQLPTAPVAEEGSLLSTHGVRLPGFTPGGESKLGRGGAPAFAQINPKIQSPAEMFGRAGFNEAAFKSKLALLRYRRSIAGGAAGGPATGFIGQGVGLFKDDTPAKRRLRADEGVITDWYDSDEAEQFFRQNPQLLDVAAQDGTAFYNQLKSGGIYFEEMYPPGKIVSTKLPGGGVSLTYDPTTGTVGVIPEEAAAERSEAFATEVSPDLLAAVIKVESNWDPDALSPKDAKGLMQVLDSTNAKPGYGVMPARDNSREERVRVGRDYLGSMLLIHEGDLDRALAAYNWGPGNVAKWVNDGADISKLPKETKNFIKRVKAAQLTVTPQQLDQAQALGAAGAAAPSTVSVDIKQGRRSRALSVAAPGAPSPVVEEMITAPDLSKIKEPDIKMPFGLYEESMTSLLALRRDLKLQVLANRGRPGSPESMKANSALSANGAMILNMTQTQALNRLQINNDPRLYNAIINRQNPGANIRVTFNSDGTLRIEMGGKVIAPRKDKGKFIDAQRRNSSAALHKALNAAQAGATKEARDLALKSLHEIRGLVTQGEYKLAEAKISKMGLFKGIENVFERRPNGKSYVLLPREDVNGNPVLTWTEVPSQYVDKAAAAFKRKK